MTSPHRPRLFDVSAAALAAAPPSITAADIEEAAAGFVPHRQLPADPPPSLPALAALFDDAVSFHWWQMALLDLMAGAFAAPPPQLVPPPGLPAPGFICEVCFDAMATMQVPASETADAYGVCENCANPQGGPWE